MQRRRVAVTYGKNRTRSHVELKDIAFEEVMAESLDEGRPHALEPSIRDHPPSLTQTPSADEEGFLGTEMRPKEPSVSPNSKRVARMKVSTNTRKRQLSPEPVSFAQKQMELEAAKKEAEKRRKGVKGIVSLVQPPAQSSNPGVLVSNALSEVESQQSNLHPNAVAFTYGKSRSFLQASPPEQDDGESNYLTGVDEGLESSDDDEEKLKELRHVHELQESGKAARFSDEIEYILSGLARTQAIGMRRASFLDLGGKCLNLQFLLQARAHNVLALFCEYIGDQDQIISAISLFILYCMCQDRRNALVLSDHPNVIPFVVEQLSTKKDVFQNAPKNKYERAFVDDVRKLIESAGLIESAQISSFHLALLCLDRLLPAISNQNRAQSITQRFNEKNLEGLMQVKFVKSCEFILQTPVCNTAGAKQPPVESKLSSEWIRFLTAYLKIFRFLYGHSTTRGKTIVSPSIDFWKCVITFLHAVFNKFMLLDAGNTVIFEAILICTQVLIDVSAEDGHLPLDINSCNGAKLASLIVIHSWEFLESNQRRVQVGVEDSNKDARKLVSDAFLQEHSAVLISSLALLANLVRNDSALCKNFRNLELNLHCGASISDSCACLVKSCILSRVINLFKGSVKNDHSMVPKTAPVIICALIGCLTSNQDTANLEFVHCLTDGYITFEEMGNLLESFAKFHATNGADGQTSSVDQTANDVVESSGNDGGGILKQMDQLMEVAQTLRRL
ncbi:hypothetical protein HDU77_006952 [Chytriomyces hyalinus]|nr:hypothetical protein HDU77_006952 [Chytriomyces hyalinus]